MGNGRELVGARAQAGEGHARGIRNRNAPSVSAASMMPSLYFMARTLAPVTMGELCVWGWGGSAVCR